MAIDNLFWEDSKKAAKGVEAALGRWSARLTEDSFTLSVAVIGANWALCGNAEVFSRNLASKISVLLIFFMLALHLFGSWIVCELFRRQMRLAEKDVEAWEKSFHATQCADQSMPWPFTKTSRFFIIWLRRVKAILPLAAGVAFIFAFVFREHPKPQPPQPACPCVHSEVEKGRVEAPDHKTNPTSEKKGPETAPAPATPGRSTPQLPAAAVPAKS